MDSKKTKKQAEKREDAPKQNLAFGLFGRRVTAPSAQAISASPSPVVDQAA